jgi:hypothetical protein
MAKKRTPPSVSLASPPADPTERVEALAVHVELLVEALVGVVVVPERRVELDALVDEGLVRLLELAGVVPRAYRRRRCCPHHDHEREGKLGVHLLHHRGRLVLPAVAAARVADHHEADR